MNQQELITEFLDEHINLPRAPTVYVPTAGTPRWLQTYHYPNVVPARPTAEQLGSELLEIAEFRALRLGSWLGTTNGQVIAKAVEAVTPPFYRQDVELLVAALQHAAALQQKEGQEAAGRYALGAIGIAALVAIVIAAFGPRTGS